MRSAVRLDLADLRLFVAVVDAGSITKGAAAANLALASASERLRHMEADAGVALLRREPRGVVTTEAGEALAYRARQILHQQALLRQELDDFAAGARGTLRLYANTSALAEFLPGRLAPWLAERPQLNLDLKERTSTEIVRVVSRGIAEAGIVSDAAEPQGLHFQRLVQDHFAFICPPGHRFAGQAAVHFAEVLGEPFISLAHGSAQQELIEGYAREAGRTQGIRIHVRTYDAMCEMVAHGIGVGILPLAAAQRQRREFDFAILEFHDAWARRWLCACYRDWAGLSAPMRSLLALLGGGQPAGA